MFQKAKYLKPKGCLPKTFSIYIYFVPIKVDPSVTIVNQK